VETILVPEETEIHDADGENDWSHGENALSARELSSSRPIINLAMMKPHYRSLEEKEQLGETGEGPPKDKETQSRQRAASSNPCEKGEDQTP
jgi:hypothetical protein